MNRRRMAELVVVETVVEGEVVVAGSCLDSGHRTFVA